MEMCIRDRGSRDSVAGPNVVLNTIIAEAFSEACDVLEQAEDCLLYTSRCV